MLMVDGSAPSSLTILQPGSEFSDLRGVTFDALGNLYVAGFGNHAVKEMLAVNGTISVSPTVVTLAAGSSWCSQSALHQRRLARSADR